MNAKPAAIALAAGLTLTLTACQPSRGIVAGRIHHGRWRYIAVRQEADGQIVKHRVGLLSGAWKHCHVGEPYPECK